MKLASRWTGWPTSKASVALSTNALCVVIRTIIGTGRPHVTRSITVRRIADIASNALLLNQALTHLNVVTNLCILNGFIIEINEVKQLPL